MKKIFVFAFILVLSCFCLCGCFDFAPVTSVSGNKGSQSSSFSSSSSPVSVGYFRVYVCGAVENEGYVEVPKGSDYNALAEAAGKLPQTYFSQNLQTLVAESTAVLALDWFDGNNVRSCINVNGGYVTLRREIVGIDPSVINRIADYIEQNGKITDKSLLKEILGEDYADNFYKFFVSVDDYEKVG